MRTILVIDDEPAILELFVSYLENDDTRVLTASNGRVAEEMLEKFPPDVIITDLLMPDKEGLETIREVKAQYPDIKIITMSGMGNEVYLKTSKMLGADIAITKPVDFTRLRSQLETMLS